MLIAIEVIALAIASGMVLFGHKYGKHAFVGTMVLLVAIFLISMYVQAYEEAQQRQSQPVSK